MARRRAARGTEDVLPADLAALRHVQGACEAVFDRAGYREIRTPLFEDTGLFERSLGEATDVVAKEMFTVERGDSSVSFRPEGTAGVVRAYLEHNLDKTRPLQKLYYAGPMFRYEKPQAGRQRQFDQIGIEALGSSSPLVDAEVTQIAHDCFAAMGLRDFTIAINTLGDAEDRERYREQLRIYMQPQLEQRCDDCRVRFEKNPLRMLDCKVRACVDGNRGAPEMVDSLRESSRNRFQTVLSLLRRLGVPYEIDPGIVRGLDYYAHTVFEVRCPDVGARSAVCGGGRYDGLIAELGGPKLGAMGFAIGVTPTLLALRTQKHPAVAPVETPVPVFVAPVSADEREAAFLLACSLRRAGLAADTDYEERSLRALMKAADKRAVRLVVVLGADEVASDTAKVKDLADGSELSVPRAELAATLAARLGATVATEP